MNQTNRTDRQVSSRWLLVRLKEGSAFSVVMPGTAASPSSPWETQRAHAVRHLLTQALCVFRTCSVSMTHLSLRLWSDAWVSLCRMSTKPISLSLSCRSWEPEQTIRIEDSFKCFSSLNSRQRGKLNRMNPEISSKKLNRKNKSTHGKPWLSSWIRCSHCETANLRALKNL